MMMDVWRQADKFRSLQQGIHSQPKAGPGLCLIYFLYYVLLHCRSPFTR